MAFVQNKGFPVKNEDLTPHGFTKLFFLDVGLTNYRIGFKEFFNKKKLLDNVYQGKISEQVAAQEIISQTCRAPSLNFWIREKGNAEIDFLYPFKEFVIPIEVKSEKVGKLKSLNLFIYGKK